MVPAKPVDPLAAKWREARKLAAAHGITVERYSTDEFWVYPPDGLYLTEEADPYDDNHLGYNKAEAIARIKAYVTDAQARDSAVAQVTARFASQIPGVVVKGRGASHSYSDHACPECGDIDGCHEKKPNDPFWERPLPRPDVPPGAYAQSLGLKYGHHYTDGEVVGVFTKDCAATPHGIEIIVSVQEGLGPIKEKLSPVKIKEAV